jgi:hypothetical protein
MPAAAATEASIVQALDTLAVAGGGPSHAGKAGVDKRAARADLDRVAEDVVRAWNASQAYGGGERLPRVPERTVEMLTDWSKEHRDALSAFANDVARADGVHEQLYFVHLAAAARRLAAGRSADPYEDQPAELASDHATGYAAAPMASWPLQARGEAHAMALPLDGATLTAVRDALEARYRAGWRDLTDADELRDTTAVLASAQIMALPDERARRADVTAYVTEWGLGYDGEGLRRGCCDAQIWMLRDGDDLAAAAITAHGADGGVVRWLETYAVPPGEAGMRAARTLAYEMLRESGERALGLVAGTDAEEDLAALGFVPHDATATGGIVMTLSANE